MPEEPSNTGRVNVPLLITAAVIFLRPELIKLVLISGISADVYSPRIFLDTFLLAVPLLTVAAAGLYPGKNLKIPAGWGVTLMLGASVAAAYYGLNAFHSFEKIIDLAGGMALMVCAATWCRGEAERHEIVRAMMLSAAVVALYGIYQYVWGFERTIEYISQEGAGALGDEHARSVFANRRIFSTMFSPDILAGFLATSLPLYFGFVSRRKSVLSNLLMIAAAASVAVALYMTGSLGGWLAACVGAAVWLVATIRDRRRRIAAVALAAVVAAALSAGIFVRRSETLLNIENRENPFVQRLFFWEGGLKTAFHHPVFGVGPGNFGISYLRLMREGAEKSRYAHSHVIAALAETGPLGLAGWAIIMFAFVAGGWKRSVSDPDDEGDNSGRKLEAGILAAGSAFLAHGFIDYDLQLPEASGFFWALVGLSAAGVWEMKPGGGIKSFAGRKIAGLVALALGVLCVLRLPGEAFMQNGKDYMELGRRHLALWSFTKAVEWRPGDTEALLERAKAWPYDPEGFVKAKADLEKAIEFSPEDPFLWWELSMRNFHAGYMRGAMEAATETRKLRPTFREAEAMQRFVRARVFISQGKLDEAAAELNIVLVEFPGHPWAMDGLAEIEQLKQSIPKTVTP